MDNIKSVSVVDTNGNLADDIIKIYADKPAVTASLTDGSTGKRNLKVSPSNVRFDSIPNISGSTYKTFLAYNGTLGYSNKVFSSVVAQNSGLFISSAPPSLEYSPSDIVQPEQAELSTDVIDIKMYNGQIDVLKYSEGVLSNGEKSYFVTSRRAYPTTVTSLPNASGKKLYMDGWYSYTTIIFRNIELGGAVSKGNFYGFKGFIFKATDNGTLFQNEGSSILAILKEGDTASINSVEQNKNENYEELLFSLNETTGLASQGNNVYVHSQILVMDEIRDAITSEAVKSAFAIDTDYVDFQNWQKLSLKRLGANVMFQNELFENAQIIIESARNLCSKERYNFNSSN
jgi:hypothetical protein